MSMLECWDDNCVKFCAGTAGGGGKDEGSDRGTEESGEPEGVGGCVLPSFIADDMYYQMDGVNRVR